MGTTRRYDRSGDFRRRGTNLQGVVHGRPLCARVRTRPMSRACAGRNPLGAPLPRNPRGPRLQGQQHRHPRDLPRRAGSLGDHAQGPPRPRSHPPLQGHRLVELRLGRPALGHLQRHFAGRNQLVAFAGPDFPLPSAARHPRLGAGRGCAVDDGGYRAPALRGLFARRARAADEHE